VSEFLVYENWTVGPGSRATIHHADCSDCNHGAGKHGGGHRKTGKWSRSFSSVQAARTAFDRPGLVVRECKKCM
jgi:hypothetical protein